MKDKIKTIALIVLVVDVIVLGLIGVSAVDVSSFVEAAFEVVGMISALVTAAIAIWNKIFGKKENKPAEAKK